MNKILEVKGLKKAYGEIKAVNGLNFYLPAGDFLAFLGPNGAGKSTTVNILCTLLNSDSGEVKINGLTLGPDDQKIRNQIGVVFQDSYLDPHLTVKENLEVRGSFYGLQKNQLRQAIDAAAQATGITDLYRRPYGKLSGGQRRRADIARALINRPQILFLDEPTTGLDPQTRRSIWETIRRLQQQHNLTVFLTTHYLEEADGADYVIIVDDGKIAVRGTPAELKQNYSTDTLRLSTAKIKQCCDCLQGYNYTVKDEVISVKLSATLQAIPLLAKCQGLFDNVEIINGTMDDVFINVTGKEIRQ